MFIFWELYLYLMKCSLISVHNNSRLQTIFYSMLNISNYWSYCNYKPLSGVEERHNCAQTRSFALTYTSTFVWATISSMIVKTSCIKPERIIWQSSYSDWSVLHKKYPTMLLPCLTANRVMSLTVLRAIMGATEHRKLTGKPARYRADLYSVVSWSSTSYLTCSVGYLNRFNSFSTEGFCLTELMMSITLVSSDSKCCSLAGLIGGLVSTCTGTTAVS